MDQGTVFPRYIGPRKAEICFWSTEVSLTEVYSPRYEDPRYRTLDGELRWPRYKTSDDRTNDSYSGYLLLLMQAQERDYLPRILLVR